MNPEQAAESEWFGPATLPWWWGRGGQAGGHGFLSSATGNNSGPS